MITKQNLNETFDKNFDSYLSEWKEYLTFQSISTDQSYDDGCKKCARWLENWLKKLGFKTELIKTTGKELVYAERKGDAKLQSVLFYGHYDVQPVDPLNLWETAPFTPTLRNGRMFARGAQDNKGQNFYVIKALETLIEGGSLKNTVKILLEGEEECGSIGIGEVLPSLKDKIKADIVLVCDSGTVSLDLPSITMGLRGIVFAEVALHAAKKDLHSGVHGGLAPNPLHGLSRLISKLHDDNGRIAIPNYYKNVRAMTEQEKGFAKSVPFTNDWYQSQTGILPIGGENGKDWAERLGFQPTIEINGMWGGYTGQGGKTVIPSVAYAKLTSRLVADQDPDYCLNLLLNFLKDQTAKGFRLEILSSRAEGRALNISADSSEIAVAADVLKGLAKGNVGYLWFGGSIPIVERLAAISGGVPVLVGFGLEEDNIHAPNESFSIEQLKMGYLFAATYFAKLSGTYA